MMDKDFHIAVLFDQYKGLLTDKQADAMGLYYNEDLSLGEIGENLGISRQGVRDAIKRSEVILQQAEQKLGFCSRLRKIESTLLQVRQEAQRIENVCPESARAILKALDSLEEE